MSGEVRILDLTVQTVTLAVRGKTSGGVYVVDSRGFPVTYVGVDVPGHPLLVAGDAYEAVRRSLTSAHRLAEDQMDAMLNQAVYYADPTRLDLSRVERVFQTITSAIQQLQEAEARWREAVASIGEPYRDESGREVTLQI